MAMTTRYVTYDAPTYEVITLDVSPTTDWAADDVCTGQTSANTCTVVAKLSALTYVVKSRNGAYTAGEVVGVTGNNDKLADQGAANPTFAAVDGSSSTYPWTWAQMLVAANAGDHVKIASGTYGRTTTSDTTTNAGTATSPIVLQGTDTSWNVLTPTRTNGNGPLITTNYPDITYSSGKFTSKAFVLLRSVKITSTGAATGAYTDAVNAVIEGCRVENSATGVNSDAILNSNISVIINNDILFTASSGGLCAIKVGTSSRILFNRITCSGGNTAPGIKVDITSQTPVVIGNQVFCTAAHAIHVVTTSGQVLLLGNTCVDATGTSHGIYFATGATGLNAVINNQLTDNGAYGMKAEDAACGIYSVFNRTARNASGADAGAVDWLDATSFGNVTTAQAGGDEATQRTNEYVSPGTTNFDYRLKPASYALGAGNLPGQAIGALQPVITIPAAADVQSGAADYGYAGALLDPSYATTAATNAAHLAADVVNLNAHKDEMIAANTQIKAHYSGVEDGTAAGGGGSVIVIDD